jgi:hypothetical protein
MTKIVRGHYELLSPGVSGEENGEGMIAMAMDYVEFRTPQRLYHLKGDMIGIAGGKALEPPDQNPI